MMKIYRQIFKLPVKHHDMRYFIEFGGSGPGVCNAWLTEHLGNFWKGKARRKLAGSWQCDPGRVRHHGEKMCSGK